jgi:DNA repair photolyase
MEFLHVNARRIINEIKGEARFGFSYTINAYRGCSHACGYCFARPTHSYLNLGIGEDFERKIVVKVNAVERLRAELHPRRWPGHSIAMGTNTDPYQRCEGKYHLTERIIDVLTEASNPFSILTKSSLILRDVERLAEAVRRTEVGVSLSIGTLDEAVWKLTEPGTPHPRRRVAAVAQLNEAGVPTGVLMGPVIPGLSDDPAQLEDVVRGCLEAGAVSIGVVLLHLRPGVKEHFLEQLGTTHPELLERYRRLYPRAYAPKAEQRRVSELVHGLVQKHGGVRVVPRRRAPRIVVPAAPAPAQLSLL